jgi:hypothetical protein
MTGLIIAITADKVVTQTVPQTEVDILTKKIIDTYQVEPSEVAVTVVYTTSGSMKLDLPDDSNEEEVITAVTTILAEKLGVHTKNVEVEVDLATGEVIWSVSTDDYVKTNELKEQIAQAELESLQTAIQTALPGTDVESFSVSEDIEYKIDIYKYNTNTTSNTK